MEENYILKYSKIKFYAFYRTYITNPFLGFFIQIAQLKYLPITKENGAIRSLKATVIQRFNAWFRQFLVPILQLGQTVILNNATFHRSKKLLIYQKRWCRILYLPTYSPDFNDIEHHWFAIKHRARKNVHAFL